MQGEVARSSPHQQELDKLPGPPFGVGVKMVLISSREFSQMFWPACLLQIHQLEPRGAMRMLIGAIFHCPPSTGNVILVLLWT